MSYLDQYNLVFSGLSDGIHQFEYSVTGDFFRELDYQEINNCNILVRVELSKMAGILELKFGFTGYIVCECDRCLEEYDQPVSGNERLIIKFGSEDDEVTDDIIILPAHENRINLSQYIYESIVLILPQRRVHPEDDDGNSKCNPEILKKLNDLANHKSIDPRWDELKKLTLKN